MKYISTRGKNEQLLSAEAVIKGLAADGGLFVPTQIPQTDDAFIQSLVPLSYEERAVKILGCFLTDYTEKELAECVSKAYGSNKFDTLSVAPLHGLKENDVLELWHGPTSAFKDMALQLLPQLMSAALKKTGETDQIMILVATSGDTGKAALEGFKDVDQIEISVFYPHEGVSKMQYLQMASQEGKNVQVFAVRGNFDDTQTGVKNIFNDTELGARLKSKHIQLSSANSINWGRLVPQIVYYFSAYADLLKKKSIVMGESVDFCVPTGNFGNILAGYYAKCMGLPVHQLICASNSNNVLTDFLETGIYDRNREFYKTITPSMDILISSNLERLLYHITKGDTAQIAAWMESLRKTGRYDASAWLPKIRETFCAGWVNDEQTQHTIREVFESEKYVLDPHTAVAWKVAAAYKKTAADNKTMVIVSTASPYKFNDAVLAALGVDTAAMDEFAMLDALAAKNPVQAPAGLAGLRQKEILHTRVCEKTEMPAVVEGSL